MFLVNNLTFAYNKVPVLKDISFSIDAGDFVGLIGPNGCGKTTLLKILSGILRPCSGSVELVGKNICDYKRAEIARIIGVVPQGASILFPFSAFEVVLMGRTPYQKAFGFESGRDIEIAKNAMNLTDTLRFAPRPIQELSGGELQRVIIARALAQEPKLLLLDEPTTFLDIKHQQDLCNLLRKLNTEHGITIVSAMHDIVLATAYCRSALLLKEGCVYKHGATQEILTRASIQEVFGVMSL